MIYSVLYGSQSNLQPPEDQEEIRNIVDGSLRRNKDLDVTGALFCTSGRFAQILEGPEIALRALMRSIEADNRHRNVRIISEEVLQERRFSQWSLAYQGPSIYVDRHIKPLLQNLPQSQTDELGARLTEMMVRTANAEETEL